MLQSQAVVEIALLDYEVSFLKPRIFFANGRAKRSFCVNFSWTDEQLRLSRTEITRRKFAFLDPSNRPLCTIFLRCHHVSLYSSQCRAILTCIPHVSKQYAIDIFCPRNSIFDAVVVLVQFYCTRIFRWISCCANKSLETCLAWDVYLFVSFACGLESDI